MTQRVFPSPKLFPAPGLAAVSACGLPCRIDVLNSKGVERYFDFTELARAEENRSVCGVDEPVIQVGEYRTWMRNLGVTPPGRPVVLGIRSGRAWFLNDAEGTEVSWFLNSSIQQLEECIAAYAEFYSGHSSFADAEKALLVLVGRLGRIDPAVFSIRGGPRLLWKAWVENLALDLGVQSPLQSDG